MRKVFLHSYLREDGTRVPYRVADADTLLPLHQDDRIEEGYFVTKEELRVIRQDAWEAGHGSIFTPFDEWVKTRAGES